MTSRDQNRIVTRFTAQTSDGVEVWTARLSGREWSEKFEDWDRWVHDVYWVVQDGTETKSVHMEHSNGWGSAQRIGSVVRRDITGNGAEEVFVLFREYVTEAGLMGQTLVIYDLSENPMTPLETVEVDAPNWNGLQQRGDLGWVDVFIEERRMQKIAIRQEPCPGDDDSSLPQCLYRIEQNWAWPDGVIVEGPQDRSWVRARVETGPLYGMPPANAWRVPDPVNSLAQAAPRGPACVLRVQYLNGNGQPFSAEVGSCASRESAGWVSSTQLSFQDSMLDEIFGERPDSPGPYVRFDWDR